MAEEMNMGEVETTESDIGVEPEELEEADENENHAVSDEDDGGDQHEFEIIDQVESDEEDAGGRSKENEDGKEGESSDTDFDDSQLHEMLEKGIDKDSITAKKIQDEEPSDGKPIIRHKIVLQDWESDPFDILPEGWVCCTHNSGMPVYLHKESRVCTMAKPYSLGNASTRRHDIPISAIPCLKYRQILKNQQKDGHNLDIPGMLLADEKAYENAPPATNDYSTTAENIPPVKQKCNPEETQHLLQQQTLPPQQDPDEILPSADSATCPHKMWMVAQDSSGQSPSQREPEELHTGKTSDFTHEITQVEPNSQLTTSHSNNNSNIDNPHSPGGENIAVKYDSSTPLKFEAYDGGYYSIDVEAAKTSLCFQENDSRDKDISITNDSSENKDSSNFPAKIVKFESDEKLLNGDISDEQHVSAANVNVCNVNTDDNPITDSSKNNIVLEETASLNSSEVVTSSTSTISSIKRKIEDWKRNGIKQRKLMDGTAEDTSPCNENNIAVDVCSKVPDERLRLHAAEVKILTAEERAKDSVLDIDAVHNYCAKLFKFKTIVVKKYKTWRERRKHLLGKNRTNRPELPSDTKLITCPIIGNNQMNGSASIYKKKEFVLNPSGKSYLCILHEYMQRTLKIQPTYVFKELENPKTPYGATVMINNIEYGTGLASSKKMAKQEAAKETLKILIPNLSSKISDQELKNTVTDLSFFDEIQVEDPRILELGNKVGQPTPFQLLRECLRRNFGMGATQCAVKTTALKNQKCEFSLTVGKHEAKVVAKNKRDGKQQAAQCILAKLHPHVPSWGSLLRLYATNVEKPMEKVEEMNEIKTHVPNKAVLENLREEMRKLHKQKEAIQSKGKMLISSKDLPSKMSCVDL